MKSNYYSIVFRENWNKITFNINYKYYVNVRQVCICILIQECSFLPQRSKGYDIIFWYFPEFYVHKPEGACDNHPWWDVKDIETRKTIIESILVELRNQIKPK